MKKKNKKGPMKETVLPRPMLYVGITTNNVLVRKGEHLLYVKVRSAVSDKREGKVHYYPVPGAARVFKECADLIEYIGPLDDEIIVNLMMFG